MKNFTHRCLTAAARGVLALSLLGGPIAAAHAQAGPYPAQRITIVVGFPPGGGVDIFARVLAEKLTQSLGQPVIVENRPGASSGVATRHVAQARPDGYTVFVNSNSMIANQLTNPEAGYDVERDLLPIGKYVSQPNAIVAHPELPANTLAEVIALSKTRDITYATPGVGSIPHLAAEHLLTVLGGARVRHIPFPGAAPALSNTAGGQVQLASVTAPTVVGMVQGNRLKPIVVSSARRMQALPAVPTAAESGFPAHVVEVWGGVFVPAATPRAVTERLDQAISQAMTLPDVREKLAAQGFDITDVKGEVFLREIGEEVRRWRDLLTRVRLQ